MNIKDFMNLPPSTEAELPAFLKALLPPSPAEANMNLAMALAGIESSSSPSPFESAVARRLMPPPKRQCYVGITMDPDRRRTEHRLSHHGKIHKWTLHSIHFSKTAAQEAENQLAGVRCHSNEGGRGDELAIWYVYSFEHEE